MWNGWKSDRGDRSIRGFEAFFARLWHLNPEIQARSVLPTGYGNQSYSGSYHWCLIDCWVSEQDVSAFFVIQRSSPNSFSKMLTTLILRCYIGFTSYVKVKLGVLYSVWVHWLHWWWTRKASLYQWEYKQKLSQSEVMRKLSRESWMDKLNQYTRGKTRVDTGTDVSRDTRSIREYPRQPYNTGVYGPVTHCERCWTGHIHI